LSYLGYVVVPTQAEQGGSQDRNGYEEFCTENIEHLKSFEV
jgi:hypothetical protein